MKPISQDRTFTITTDENSYISVEVKFQQTFGVGLSTIIYQEHFSFFNNWAVVHIFII